MKRLRRRYGRSTAGNPELESYRKEAIETLKRNGRFICDVATSVLGSCKGVYVVGSVLDKSRFREDSDIDIAILVDGASPGLSETMSGKLQDEMIRHPIGDVGVVNTLVFVGKVTMKRGKISRIWPKA